MRDIILLSIDSLRADHCGFLEYDRDTTPFLSNPPCERVVFKNAISPSSWTLSSMKGIFTGEIFNDSPTDMLKKRKKAKLEFDRQTSLPYRLNNLGYATIGFSPNPHASSDSGFDYGFDYFDGFDTESGITYLPNKLQTLRQFLQSKGGFTTGNKQLQQIKTVHKKYNNPNFIWSFLLDTHIPFQISNTARKYSSSNNMYLQNLYYWNKIGAADSYGRVDFNEKNTKKMVDLYDDSIRSIDEFIKKLWNFLKEDDPIFIIHGDHGEAFGEHGFYSHSRELYDELIHVPLIILNAGISQSIEKVYSLLNLFELVPKLRNKNFSEVKLKQEKTAIAKVFEKSNRKIAVRSNSYKYIHYDGRGNEYYNLKKDPHEQNNLIDSHPVTSGIQSLINESIHKEETDKIKNSIASLFQ